ncbi:MAG TPA: hypothetical protein VFD60_00840, partial [Nitrososphaeraceae archaeon]|nr:hypothetical protein [Nitrososphaeraceae archaeon]
KGTVGINKDSTPIITSIGSNYILTVDTASNQVKRISSSSLGVGNTIYSGDGTLAGNRTLTGSSNNLTLATIGNFQVNANNYVFEKNNATFPYTAAIIGSGNVWEIGYTPTPGTFNKGAGVIIDTNNNVSLGAQIPSTAPLYSSGVSTYVNGFQNQAGNFYRVDSVTTDITANLTQYNFRINAASNNVTITLPAASTAFAGTIGIVYVFKRLDNSGNTVTIQTSSGNLIDGASSFTLTTQYQTKVVQCVSTTAWDVISKN